MLGAGRRGRRTPSRACAWSSARRSAARSERRVGVGGHRGLEVAHADAGQGRHARDSGQRRGPEDGRYVGLRDGQAAGNQCKAYGAGGIMRMPTRLRIGWQLTTDTLKIETDAGQQTRLLHFDRRVSRRVRARSRGIPWPSGLTSSGRGRGGRGGGPRARVWHRRHARRDDESARGLPAQERCAVQPERRRDRVRRPVTGPDGAQWLIVKTTVERSH